MFRCVGTNTILASMICPPRAMMLVELSNSFSPTRFASVYLHRKILADPSSPLRIKISRIRYRTGREKQLFFGLGNLVLDTVSAGAPKGIVIYRPDRALQSVRTDFTKRDR